MWASHYRLPFPLLVLGVLSSAFMMTEAQSTCDNFTDAHACRESNCKWHCTMGTCNDPAKELHEECSQDPGCAQYCFQPCECRNAGCDYHALGGECRPSGAVCTPFSFNHQALLMLEHDVAECQRPAVYYSSAGSICYNRVRRGDCNFADVLNSVNFVGPETYDHRGIYYTDEFCGDVLLCGYRDDFQTVKEGAAPKIILEHPGDIDLYKDFIYGSSEVEDENACIKLPVFIRDPGVHEVCMMMGDFNGKIGERNFDIYFIDEEENHEDIRHEFVIAKAFDPMVYQIDARRGIELCFNVVVVDHVVSGKHLYVVQGYTNWEEFHPESFALSLCYGDCSTSKEHGYVISAYHVLRFDDF